MRSYGWTLSQNHWCLCGKGSPGQTHTHRWLHEDTGSRRHLRTKGTGLPAKKWPWRLDPNLLASRLRDMCFWCGNLPVGGPWPEQTATESHLTWSLRTSEGSQETAVFLWCVVDSFHMRGFNLPARCPPHHPCHSCLTGWGPACINPLQTKFRGVDFLVVFPFPGDPHHEGVQEGAPHFRALKSGCSRLESREGSWWRACHLCSLTPYGHSLGSPGSLRVPTVRHPHPLIQGSSSALVVEMRSI